MINKNNLTFSIKRFSIGVLFLCCLCINACVNTPKGPAVPGEDFFIKAYFDKDEAYSNEQVTLFYDIYYKRDLTLERFAKEPILKSFWIEDLPTQANLMKKKEKVTVNEKLYEKATFRKVALFPMDTGFLSVDPGSVNAIDPYKNPHEEYFNLNQSNGPPQHVIDIEPVNIKVKALPPPNKKYFYPENVGRFQLTAKIDAGDIDESGCFDLIIAIKGEGNIRHLKLAPIVFDDAFLLLNVDEQVDVEFKGSANPATGEKKFIYKLHPKKTGELKLPEICFTFFDPQKKEYISSSIENLSFLADKLFPEVVAQKSPEINKREDSVFILLDGSGSMLARDFFPDRFNAARHSLIPFIESLNKLNVGLGIFGKNYIPLSPLGEPVDEISENLKSFEWKKSNQEGTALGNALYEVLNQFTSSGARKKKSIVLVFDGEFNTGYIHPLTAIEAVKKNDIVLYLIFLASTHDMIPFPPAKKNKNAIMAKNYFDESFSQQLVDLTGGKLFRATNQMELDAVLQEIRKLVD